MVLWTAWCMLARGISNALATTQYEVLLANQNRKTRASMKGPQTLSYNKDSLQGIKGCP